MTTFRTRRRRAHPIGSPIASIVAPTVRDDASNGPGTEVEVSLRGERSTPTDAINRPTSVHGSAGASNSAGHWGDRRTTHPCGTPTVLQ